MMMMMMLDEEEDDWEKAEEDDNWDPDFEEFDLPKSKPKRALQAAAVQRKAEKMRTILDLMMISRTWICSMIPASMMMTTTSDVNG